MYSPRAIRRMRPAAPRAGSACWWSVRKHDFTGAGDGHNRGSRAQGYPQERANYRKLSTTPDSWPACLRCLRSWIRLAADPDFGPAMAIPRGVFAEDIMTTIKHQYHGQASARSRADGVCVDVNGYRRAGHVGAGESHLLAQIKVRRGRKRCPAVHRGEGAEVGCGRDSAGVQELSHVTARQILIPLFGIVLQSAGSADGVMGSPTARSLLCPSPT